MIGNAINDTIREIVTKMRKISYISIRYSNFAGVARN